MNVCNEWMGGEGLRIEVKEESESDMIKNGLVRGRSGGAGL